MRTIIFVILMALPASIATAQVNIDECTGNPTACSVVSSTTSSTTTAILGGIVLTVILGSNRNQAVGVYLKQNAIAIRRDLNLGYGPTIDDLAALFGVSPRALGLWLRRIRVPATTIVETGDGQAFATLVTMRFWVL